MQNDAEVDRTKIEEQRQKMEKAQNEWCLKVEEKQVDLAQSRSEIGDRPAAIDKKRIALDDEKRTGVWEECKQVLVILEALVKKLS